MYPALIIRVCYNLSTMEGVLFIKPGRSPEVPITPVNPELQARKQEIATSLRQAIEDAGKVSIADASTISEIAGSLIGDDDTAWPRDPVILVNHENTFEVTLDGSFNRVLDDGSLRPGEPITMPIHATSIFFFTAHDRSDSWYCTSIITCEDERLLQGESEHPFFVWVKHA